MGICLIIFSTYNIQTFLISVLKNKIWQHTTDSSVFEFLVLGWSSTRSIHSSLWSTRRFVLVWVHRGVILSLIVQLTKFLNVAKYLKMSEEKLSSDEVPTKFAEWLLAMGCPPEDVPPIEMCRGQYYMVWRSLMEHVGPKDTILKKRLQVFNNDIVKCQKKNVFNELDVNMPKVLSLWRQHTDLKQQVAEVEARVAEGKENLNQLVNKVSSKLAQRNLSRKRLQDAQRRSWLLQQVSAELQERKKNLQETKTIADSLCCLDDSQDLEGKLDKCISAISRPSTATAGRSGASLLSVANPVASSSLVSTNGENDAEEHVASLVKCRGDVVFKQVFERRAGLCAMPAARPIAQNKQVDRQTPQSVLAHTAALHCTLALEAVRNRAHIKHTGKRLAATLKELNNYLSTEACELLVLRCELAYTSARAVALRSVCDELRARTGIFATAQVDNIQHPASLIHNVDKSILSKREELKRLIVSSAAVERKMQNVRESLVAMFNSLHATENDRFEGQMSVSNTPHASISTVRQFYEERREKRKNKMELSMDLDLSEGCSYNDLTDNGSPKFIDELRMYLRRFNLEKNRKLILESSEKIWIFETVQSSVNCLHSHWLDNDITTSMLCPSVCLSRNLADLTQEVAWKNELEALDRFLESGRKKYDLTMDITSAEEEQRALDIVKKRLNENLLSLQKTGKNLDLGMENLRVWAANSLKQHISESRTVDGRTYRDYERAYLESLRDMQSQPDQNKLVQN